MKAIEAKNLQLGEMTIWEELEMRGMSGVRMRVIMHQPTLMVTVAKVMSQLSWVEYVTDIT